jgi:rhodanese-related sulfurtransferase
MFNTPRLLNNDQLKSLLVSHKDLNDFVIVDIREPSEYVREHIAKSINVPLNKLKQYDFSNFIDKVVIFHCQSGMRTRSAKDQLQATGIKQVYCLEGGIDQWKQCGMSTLINKNAPLGIMRQVQIAAGILILLGVLFSYVISPFFIILTIFVGSGLIFAGITGFCGMAKLLFYMPWNK